MKRAVACAVATAFGLALVACLHDFDAFGPATTDDGGGSSDASPHDASAGADGAGASDALPAGDGCTPSASCLSDATTCAKACHDARTTCESACNGRPPCLSDCASTEANCLTTCATKCNTCAANAGCAAPSECKNAAK